MSRGKRIHVNTIEADILWEVKRKIKEKEHYKFYINYSCIVLQEISNYLLTGENLMKNCRYNLRGDIYEYAGIEAIDIQRRKD